MSDYEKLYQAASALAGAFWRLERDGCIVTDGDDNEEAEAQRDHWKSIADQATEDIRAICRGKRAS